jgi:hypothetical protein
MEIKGNQNTKGLNLDSINWQVEGSQLTWALNANIMSHDGNTFTYTNEMSNQICVNLDLLKPGYRIVGILNIIEQDKVVVFLLGPDGKGEIGVIKSNANDCIELDEVETDCGCVGGRVKSTQVIEVLKPQGALGFECPPGYTYNSQKQKCIKVISVPAVEVKETLSLSPINFSAAFGFQSPVLYDPGWNVRGWGGDGSFNSGFTLVTAAWWRFNSFPFQLGRVNTIGVYSPSAQSVNKWLGFKTTICIDQSKTYYLAISADNNFRVKLDDIIILDPSLSATTFVSNDHDDWKINVYGSVNAVNANTISYGRLHIYPIQLTAGNHLLEIEYVDYGGLQQVAAEIYNNTSAEILAATDITDLDVIWTTEGIDQVEFIISRECPSGYEIGIDSSCSYGCTQDVEEELIPITVPGFSCCEYEPILIDECCQDCCQECVVARFQITNSAGGQGSVFMEYTDCDGVTRTTNVLNGTSFPMLKDSWRVVSKSAPTVSFQLLSEIPIENDCAPCLNPSPENCCLNFDVENPVYATYRVDQCETRIYFVDRKNPPRYLSLEFPLNRDACGQSQDCDGKKLVTKKSCGELKIFPDTCHPKVTPVRVSSGGQLKAGVYQFAIAYADEEGAELTDYFDFSQPIPIFEKKLTNLTDYVTNNAITVQIDHKANIFEFFNLVVAETIQGATTNYYLVGTYRVQQQFLTDNIVYSGEYKSSFSSISPLIRTPYYNTAGIVENQNDILMIADLEKEYQYNLQPLANKLKLQWETVQMPHGDKWDYSNPEIAYMFRTYQRDEVYAFGIKFKLKSGKYTEVFHIPGRPKSVALQDTESIPTTNTDFFIEQGDCADPLGPKERWEVYNTAGTGVSFPAVDPTELEKQFSCAIFNDKRGEFAYWESTEKYPCNEEIWDKDASGNILAGQPIRFHKFPDSLVSHIHDGLFAPGNAFPNFDQQTTIYPIGVRVDADIFNNLINNLQIANPENPDKPFLARDLICGFELVYATRVGHKSVVAKGLLYDVGFYKTHDSSKQYYYPNYPFNDINWRGSSSVVDPYLKTNSEWYNKAMGLEPNNENWRHFGFVDNGIINYKHKRFTFHSPDTHFSYPKIGAELKIETLEIGKVFGHFVEVEEHTKLKLFTENISTISGLLSLLLNMKSKGLDTSLFIQDREMFTQLIERLIPRVNFAWQYNGVAKYNGYLPITNAGHKRRSIRFGNYAPSEILNFGQGEKPFHNRFRETSVYLSLNTDFNHHYPNVIDNSRYKASNHQHANRTDIDTSRTTRAYYGSVKTYRPNQYGPLTNLRYMSTGYSVDIVTNLNNGLGQLVETYYPAFGGDTFINAFALKRKHAFYRQNLAGKLDDIPFNYYLFPNLGYPTYFYSYQQKIQDLKTFLLREIAEYSVLLLGGVTFAYVVGGLLGDASGAGEAAWLAVEVITKLSIIETINDALGKLTPYLFIDDDETKDTFFYYKGKIYLFSYGLPIFFVESDVNVDFRHGRNDREENFYGAKELGEIPDQWLQEVNVPIKYDNFYHYNPTYSVQNVINPNFPYNEVYPELYCETDLYNRVIYSDPAGKYRKGDPWLNFRRGNFYDFPKTTGKLIALNGVENGKVYARFENNTKVYNAIITLDSNNPIAMEIGNASMFNQKPIEMSTADIGYLGTQHKAFVKTTHGGFWVDARRGHVYQVTSGGIDEISLKGSMQWFKENLPFKMLKDFPDFPVDNTFKGIGISLGWDERFHRLFLTKLDYRVKEQFRGIITYSDKKLFYGTTEIEFADPRYFENHSFTISYSVLLKAWISFHSFLPSAYVSFLAHFQTVTPKGTWNHNLSPLVYQTYYDKFYPYVLEYTVNTAPNTTVVNAVTYNQDIHKYYNRNDYYSLGSYNDKNTPNFTKAIIYNKEQTSGLVNLIPQLPNDARQKLLYPRVSRIGTEVLVTKRDLKNTFNGFWDATNNKENFQTLFSTRWDDISTDYPIDKVINPKSVITTTRIAGKQKIRSTFCKVRLIQDKYNRYKFINNLQLTQTSNSVI